VQTLPRIAYNGRILTIDSLPSQWGFNRAFYLGDGLFESMRASKGRVLWLEHHYARLIKGMEHLGMEFPPHFSFDTMKDLCEELLATNKINQGGRLRLTVYRSGTATNLPNTDTLEYIIESHALLDTTYLWTRPLRITICPEYSLVHSVFSEIKSLNRQVYTMAARFAQRGGFDNALLCASTGALAEFTNGNLFLVRGNILLTPPVSTGCLAGVIRRVILEKANTLGFEVMESEFDVRSLAVADEAFGTNALTGIFPVRSIDSFTFSAYRATLLFLGALNEWASH